MFNFSFRRVNQTLDAFVRSFKHICISNLCVCLSVFMYLFLEFESMIGIVDLHIIILCGIVRRKTKVLKKSNYLPYLVAYELVIVHHCSMVILFPIFWSLVFLQLRQGLQE